MPKRHLPLPPQPLRLSTGRQQTAADNKSPPPPSCAKKNAKKMHLRPVQFSVLLSCSQPFHQSPAGVFVRPSITIAFCPAKTKRGGNLPKHLITAPSSPFLSSPTRQPFPNTRGQHYCTSTSTISSILRVVAGSISLYMNVRTYDSARVWVSWGPPTPYDVSTRL